MKVAAVLLAAGQGTRMKSDLPKMLHPICGKPMLAHSLASVMQASDELPVVIVGHEADQVRESVSGGVRFVIQDQQLGTGHAVLQTESLLKEAARKKVKQQEMDEFWNKAAEQNAGKSTNPEVISYEEARKMGLTPDSKK